MMLAREATCIFFVLDTVIEYSEIGKMIKKSLERYIVQLFGCFFS